MNPIASWFERRRVDREMQDEMAAHLAEKIDDLVTAGHSAQDARRLARQQMGNPRFIEKTVARPGVGTTPNK